VDLLLPINQDPDTVANSTPDFAHPELGKTTFKIIPSSPDRHTNDSSLAKFDKAPKFSCQSSATRIFARPVANGVHQMEGG
jgi:hypothetical protein